MTDEQVQAAIEKIKQYFEWKKLYDDRAKVLHKVAALRENENRFS
jgi:acyl-CoA reductase-like NAD-dependent aldehyde dehydrogenase